jgi:hypothetical protein
MRGRVFVFTKLAAAGWVKVVPRAHTQTSLRSLRKLDRVARAVPGAVNRAGAHVEGNQLLARFCTEARVKKHLR